MPTAVRIVFAMTLILLIGGALGFFVFEFNGTLNGLSVPDRMANAWFQSATARTAGFNSVSIGAINAKTYLLMLFLMFAGGSPGGTAGGVRTMVLAVLALTFWSDILNRDSVTAGNRRIPVKTVLKAVTITVAYCSLLGFFALMLLATQPLPGKALVFEAFSALGTVGLSMDATPKLNEIGRVTVILMMFAGRVGPVTLFMLLSGRESAGTARYPDTNLSLT